MGVSTAVSVVSFSVVLAEVFAAVGLSTIIPAGVVTLARLVKEWEAEGTDSRLVFKAQLDQVDWEQDPAPTGEIEAPVKAKCTIKSGKRLTSAGGAEDISLLEGPVSVVILAGKASADGTSVEGAVCVYGEGVPADLPAQFTGPAAKVADFVKAARGSLTELNLLLPQHAKIHAEFSFEGREQISGAVGLGGESGQLGSSIVACVGVSAGYSALYEAKSTNRITLDVEFAAVNIPL